VLDHSPEAVPGPAGIFTSDVLYDGDPFAAPVVRTILDLGDCRSWSTAEHDADILERELDVFNLLDHGLKHGRQIVGIAPVVVDGNAVCDIEDFMVPVGWDEDGLSRVLEDLAHLSASAGPELPSLLTFGNGPKFALPHQLVRCVAVRCKLGRADLRKSSQPGDGARREEPPPLAADNVG